MFLVTDVQEATGRGTVIVSTGGLDTDRAAEAADTMRGVQEEAVAAAAADVAIKTTEVFQTSAFYVGMLDLVGNIGRL